MPSRTFRPILLAVLVLAASGLPAAAANKVNSQLEFGVQMARRGLWSEALFRFDQALSLEPGSPRILNNMAVAYEAVGQFEKALATYQEALKIAPSNADLKKNYAQFLEFYQGFRPRESGAQAAPSDAAPQQR
jgi:Tfp pilus assembly protein PilF